MRWTRRCCLLVVLIAAGASAGAEAPLPFKPPERFWVTLQSEYKRTLKTQKETTKDQTQATQVLAVTVLKTNADGSRLVELKVEAFKEALTDAAGKRRENARTELHGTAFQVTLDAEANVTAVAGVDELVKKLSPKASNPVRAYQLEYWENVVRNWGGQIFPLIPAKPVDKGYKWHQLTIRTMAAYGNLKLTKELTYQGTETVDGQELHKLTFTTAHAFSPLRAPDAYPFKVTRVSFTRADYAGTIYLDKASGHIVSADAKETRDLVMTLAYEVLNRDVRSNDEGASSVRFHAKNPLP